MERDGGAAAPSPLPQNLPGHQARALVLIRSRDNARVKRWARLSQDGRLRRREGRALVEGPHLVSAAAAAGLKPICLLVSETRKPEVDQLVRRAGAETIELSDSVFRAIVDAESPQGIAAEIEIPAPRAGRGDHVFLEGVQDAGNVGAILRTAAAFGVSTVVLDRACADPWSPKVLRAGMGGHFLLSIEQVSDLEAALERFKGQILCTVAKGGVSLRDTRLSRPLAWIFGSEGKGVSEALQAIASDRVTIPTATGMESLNVAAAAAICLYATSSTPAAGS